MTTEQFIELMREKRVAQTLGLRKCIVVYYWAFFKPNKAILFFQEIQYGRAPIFAYKLVKMLNQ